MVRRRRTHPRARAHRTAGRPRRRGQCRLADRDGGVRPGRDVAGRAPGWVEECGYHCAGESAPRAHAARPPAAASRRVRSRADHAGMSMAAMARDMRNRFVVAVVLAVPIMLWSPMGTAILGRQLPAPVRPVARGLPVPPQPAGDLLLVGLFFRGAVRALARTHARHDGAGGRRHRRRLGVLGGGDVLDRRRGLLRGRRLPGRLRAARSLVRDARPRRRQRRRPRAARPGAAQGGRRARRRDGRGADQRGASSATSC